MQYTLRTLRTTSHYALTSTTQRRRYTRLPTSVRVYILCLLITDLEMVSKVKKIIAEICEAKRQQRIHPALATEIEIKQELIRQGVRLSAAEFKELCAAMAEDEDIITHRLLQYNGYELRDKYDADTTETNT